MKKSIFVSIFLSIFIFLSGSLFGMNESVNDRWKNDELVGNIIKSEDLSPDRKKNALKILGFHSDALALIDEWTQKIQDLHRKHEIMRAEEKQTQQEVIPITAENIAFRLIDEDVPERVANDWIVNNVFTAEIVNEALRIVQEQRIRRLDFACQKSKPILSEDDCAKRIIFFVEQLKGAQDIDEAKELLGIIYPGDIDNIEIARQHVLAEKNIIEDEIEEEESEGESSSDDESVESVNDATEDQTLINESDEEANNGPVVEIGEEDKSSWFSGNTLFGFGAAAVVGYIVYRFLKK